MSHVGKPRHQMLKLEQLRLRTTCSSCINKCCSQPYDWVFLTSEEIARLQAASGQPEQAFSSARRNPTTGHVFKTLNLPCVFLDENGACKVYDSRPLICKLFPFYLEPLTGHATLLPIQCGENLIFEDPRSSEGWCLGDHEDDAYVWLATLWEEARLNQLPSEPIARTEGSP